MKRNAWAEAIPVYFAIKSQQKMHAIPLKFECESWDLTEEQRDEIRRLLRPLTRATYQKAWNTLHPRVLTPAQRMQAKIRRARGNHA